MRYFITVAMAAMLMACTAEKETPMVGGDRTAEGCIPSAGYQWSKAKEDCVRLWEAGVELVHQGSGDPDYSAWAITAEDKVEIIIKHDNQHVLLEREGDRSAGYIWGNDLADMALILNENGTLQLEDSAGFVMYAQEGATPESGYDNIPDHSYDEAGGEIIQAKGIVKMVEDGAYPQFTLHIDLDGESETTVFNLIAEGAELNGADLGLLDGKAVDIEYVLKESNELMRIGPKGSFKFEDIEAAGDWFFAEGRLEGADEVTMSDLPDTLTIWEAGAAIHFDYFTDDELVMLNGKEVSAVLFPNTVNDIHWLKVAE